MTGLYRLLADAAGAHPTRVALRQGVGTVTYCELAEQARGVAAVLHEDGLRPGDRVGLMLPNVPHFPALFFGALHAGCVVVPMNPLLRAREVAHYVADSGARLVFAWHEVDADARETIDASGARTVRIGMNELPLGDWAGDPAQPDGRDTAVILYTSGTTGLPKGAELTHDNLWRNAELTARTLLQIGPDDVVTGCLPLFHVFGLTCALNAAIVGGATLSLLPRFDPRAALETIARDRVSVFLGVPTMYAALLAVTPAPVDTSSLRVCISGGAALPVELLHEFERTFGCPILEGYGLSETSPVAAFNHPGRPRKPGSIGVPVEGTQMRVIDDAGRSLPPGEVGEIAVRGHHVMKGYWRQPDATAAVLRDGWFATGDLGRVDDDGYFYIVDRQKDLIIRGGYNVYPREVEEVLYEHPAVAEAAVVGLPDRLLGEEVGAAVALKPGSSTTPDELRNFVKARLAAYKYPRRVWFVDALPKGATGKIMRRRVVPPTCAVQSDHHELDSVSRRRQVR